MTPLSVASLRSRTALASEIFIASAQISKGRKLFLQSYSRNLSRPSFDQQPEDARRSLLVGEPLRSNVGDAVSFCVRASGHRIPSEIRAQTIGRTQSRPFADQDEYDRRLPSLADLIADGNAPLLHKRQRRSGPTL